MKGDNQINYYFHEFRGDKSSSRLPSLQYSEITGIDINGISFTRPKKCALDMRYSRAHLSTI